MDTRIDDILQQLTLEEKVSLLSGADAWHTREVERLGIPAIRMTDGPNGVRRPYDDDSNSWPATSFPTGTALAATWNVDLVSRIGEALAEETRSKGCDILLGPAVNIHRTPLCGRNFEYFSEDPYLTGRMAVAWIQGIQSRGVGASIKHFAANNTEFERSTLSSDISERALREIYLPAFEAAVKEARPWTVMCSYNKINGVWASENRYLLTEILKEEWGFEGLVVSDWGAVHNRIRAINAGLDLEMPGMGELPGRILADAVRRGLVPEAAVDAAVRRILRVVFMARGDRPAPQFDPGAADTPEHRRLAREAAEEAVVLLKNEGGLLPLDEQKIRSIAVFGPNANAAQIQGGGSAQVNPYYSISPLEGILQRAGQSISVTFRQGCKNNITPPPLDSAHVQTLAGADSAAGFQVDYFAGEDFDGEPFFSRIEQVARFSTQGIPADLLEQVNGKPISVRWSGKFTAPVSGLYTFGLTSAGLSRLRIDGQVVVDHWDDPDVAELIRTWPWKSKFGERALEAGKSYDLQIEYRSVEGAYRLLASCDIPLPKDEMEQVARLAAQADVAVVCVGTTWEHETEGKDRESWDLPGEQAELIRVVARANPRTVVVLTNGGTIEMASWINRVPAVLEAWFTGQESGAAIAEVLFGDVNPSGKLVDTFPVHYKDNPTFINYPGENGHLLYGEGIFVGYRYYDAKDLEPLFPFGYGLSYTTFAYQNLRLSSAEMSPDETLEVSIDIRNSGPRAGKEVVQLYLRDIESRLVRPPKELKGFHKVALEPGEVKTVRFTLTCRDLSYYDTDKKSWVAEPGVFEVLVGSSSRDIRAGARFTLRPGPAAPPPRFNEHTNLLLLFNDPQARAVLERHLPELMATPEVTQYAQLITLNFVHMSFMELLPPDKFRLVLDDLALIS